ncbi:RNA polymerase sigma factor [Mucilaginibacter flavus]|uniref:RNA polymerase sigma factor n=1 Tax=Mucilaginibacter flavus TaxID=931504 RepID=UPI0025B59F82|nr:sigma-70 family RNA polymerase sigma factor [Mucilaginibacter flavus]MDN3582387.1 sigma-70 family RNA polymerase sigma factor [Mucilaginibacter flavus]
MNLEEDKGWVYRLYSGDVTAFDAIYHKYHHAIYRNIYKFTKDEDVSQDIMQDIFIALWEKRMEINPDKSLSGWLFVLSFNRSISYLRRKLKETTIVNTIPFDEAEPDIESIQLIDDQYYLLYEAINQLSPQKKKVFTLCKLEGKTYEEAAEKLNLSKHTVKEYLGNAVTSVKSHINSNPVGLKAVSVIVFCYWCS